VAAGAVLPSSNRALFVAARTQTKPVKDLIEAITSNSRLFEADGRVLRLKQYLPTDVGPAVIDAVIDALEVNTRVEALYIQHFEKVRSADLGGLGISAPVLN
jgi:hypothetical protein